MSETPRAHRARRHRDARAADRRGRRDRDAGQRDDASAKGSHLEAGVAWRTSVGEGGKGQVYLAARATTAGDSLS